MNVASAARRLWWRIAASKGALSIVDQAAISAGNFTTGVVLARSLDPASFGLFVLSSMFFWFVLTMQNGLLLSPLAIQGAALDDAHFGSFLRAHVVLQTALALVSSLLVAAAAMIWEPLRPLALPLAVATLSWQAQEFCRRVLYTRALMGSAVICNAVNYDVQVPALVLAARLGWLSVGTALWIIAATSALAVAVSLGPVRRCARGHTDDVRRVARQAFGTAKWTGPSAAFAAAASQWYPALVSALVGLASAGAVGVLFQLLNPVNLLVRPLQSYFLPLAIRSVAHDGRRGLDRVLVQATLFTAPAYLLYMIIIALVPEFALELVYGGTYVMYADALRWMALVAIVGLPVYILVLELGARRLQKLLFFGDVWAALVACGVGAVLIARFSLLGVPYTILVVAVGQLAYFSFLAVRERSAEPHLAQRAPGEAARAPAVSPPPRG